MCVSNFSISYYALCYVESHKSALTTVDRENPNFLSYLIKHGQKILVDSCFACTTRSEVANCVCVT